MTEPRMWVRRHVVTCRAFGAGWVTPSALRDALGRPFEERLAEAPWWAGCGDGYLLVRRLQLRVIVGSGWDAAIVSTAVARDLVTRLGALMDRRGDADNVLWFPDRASFLARFLVDLAEGRAEGRWEYAQFGSTGTDPVLVELSAQEPADVFDALLLLAPRDRQRVFAGLSRAREDELIVMLTAAAMVSPSRERVVIATGELRSSGLLHYARTALALALAAAAGSRDEFVGAVAPAREVADLLALLDVVGPRAHELLGRLVSGDWSSALGVAGTDAADALLPFVDWSPGERVALAEALDETGLPDERMPDRVRTPLGGAFLLLQVLDDLGDWGAATRGWPPLGAVTPEHLVKLLCLASALGRGRTADGVNDPVLRMVLAVPPSADAHTLGGWVTSVEEPQVEEFLAAVGRRGIPGAVDPTTRLALPGAQGPAADLVGRVASALVSAFGRRLPGMGAASASYLVDNLLDVEAWVTLEGRSAVVELGHPPLDVLLMLSGMNRGSFRFAGSEVTWTLTSGP